mmetsp:Transcript_122366/g.193824  ORF Transcript_122366/g.193824 Transcript_122366/m.193824 type:complete len:315 (-) Transcript_122366:43-987(-)
MGNTICHTPCCTNLQHEVDLCSLMSAANTVDAEFAKTPRVEPLHHSEPSKLISEIRVPTDVPPLNLRKPGETHREHLAIAQILANQANLTHRSDCSSDSGGGGNETAADAYLLPTTAQLGLSSSSQNSNLHLTKSGLQLPKLHLRPPGETPRERAALAKILALPQDTSRSEFDGFDEPLPTQMAHVSCPSSSQSGSNIESTLAKPLVPRTDNAVPMRVLEADGLQVPKLQLRAPGETHRESAAMAKILAGQNETSRSDWSQKKSNRDTDRVSNPQDPDSKSNGSNKQRVQLKGVQVMVPKDILVSNREASARAH